MTAEWNGRVKGRKIKETGLYGEDKERDEGKMVRKFEGIKKRRKQGFKNRRMEGMDSRGMGQMVKDGIKGNGINEVTG